MKDPVEVERLQSEATALELDMTPHTWRHWKGDDYRVICVAIDEVTLVPVVVYKSLFKSYLWTRPLSEWNAIVALDDGTTVPRFRRVT